MSGARRGLQDQARGLLRATEPALVRSPMVGMAAQLRHRSLVWAAVPAKSTSPVQAPGGETVDGDRTGVIAGGMQGVARPGGHAFALAANPAMFVRLDMTQRGVAASGIAQSKVAASDKLGLARSRSVSHESVMSLASLGAGSMLAAGILAGNHASPLVHHMMLMQNRRVRFLSGKSAPEVQPAPLFLPHPAATRSARAFLSPPPAPRVGANSPLQIPWVCNGGNAGNPATSGTNPVSRRIFSHDEGCRQRVDLPRHKL